MGLKGSNTNQTCFCGYAVCCFSAHTSPLPSLPPTPYASRLCIVNCFSTVIWQWVLQLSLSSTKCRDVVNKEVKGSRRIARNTSLYLELEKTGREKKKTPWRFSPPVLLLTCINRALDLILCWVCSPWAFTYKGVSYQLLEQIKSAVISCWNATVLRRSEIECAFGLTTSFLEFSKVKTKRQALMWID